MSDLLQTARLFEVSTKLQSTSSLINRYAEGYPLDSNGRKIFQWAGSFLTRVDWNSDIEAEPGVGGGLTVSATSTRPKFYESLLKIAPKLNEVGIQSETDVQKFLGGLYKLLISEGKKRNGLQKSHLKVAGELLHVLSKSIIVELNNNGLPKRTTNLSIGDLS